MCPVYSRLVFFFFFVLPLVPRQNVVFAASVHKILKGQSALDHLSAAGLVRVAAAHHMLPKDLEKALKNDSSLRLHITEGKELLAYIESVPPQSIGSTGEIVPSSTLGISSSVQAYSSIPGARHTIYLDFDGHVTEGTNWNTYFSNPSIVSPPYDVNGDASSFNEAEATQIREVWQRVSEDYAPFNVNVTTVEPSIEDLTYTGSGDTRWGVRVVITKDNVGCGCGGVAYVNSFNWADIPVFVFTKSAKNVTEAASHEIGHALGLSHDGTSTAGYYKGHGSGETGWAPIMGVGYYQNVSQWSKGEYTGANNFQDDLQIISTQNGFGYRLDDHSDALSGATLVPLNESAAIQGRIERNTDSDLFQIPLATTGTLAVGVLPYSPGPNLDLKLELLDQNGAVLAVLTPAGALASGPANFIISQSGNYFLRVQGDGNGDPLLSGYSKYGSLGRYSLGVSFASDSASLAPVASFYSSAIRGLTPLPVYFDAFPSFSPSGLALTYNWDFGDGSTGSGKLISHTFNDESPHVVVLTVIDSNSKLSTFSQEINPASTCERSAPTIALSPTLKQLKSGDSVTYSVTITNTDPLDCSSSLFSFSPTMELGWAGGVTPGNINLSPDSSTIVLFGVTAPSSAFDGNYAVGLTALRSAAPGVSGSAMAMIDNTPPTAPSSLTASVSRRGVNLSWNASSDSGTGVEKYEIFRNGILLASSSGTSYTDRTGTSGMIYVVYAYDRLGNKSAASNTAIAGSSSPGGGGKKN